MVNRIRQGARQALTVAGVALCAASPAAAQTGLCGGVGVGGTWIGGTEAASDLAKADAAREQMALVLMRNEHVALFSVSEPAEIRVEAQARGNGDPMIDLRDAAGRIFLSDDDSGGDSAARGEIVLAPGTYCLSTRSFNGTAMTAFVRIGRTEHTALTPGIDAAFAEDGAAGCGPDTPATDLADGPIDALIAGAGLSVTGSADAVPFWRFVLAAPAQVSLTATNSNADPMLSLYDASGDIVAENDDFDGLDSRIDFGDALAAGSYCIGVRALSDSTLPITVAVAAYDPDAALVNLYDRGDAGPSLNGSHPVNDLGVLSSRLRHDAQTSDRNSWFSVVVEQAGVLLVEAVANGQGDPTLVLYDDFGRLVAQNDDNGTNLDSLILTRVQPGTYLVGVRQVGTATQGLIRLLFERYVAVP
jgi:hypothetical protein